MDFHFLIDVCTAISNFNLLFQSKWTVMKTVLNNDFFGMIFSFQCLGWGKKNLACEYILGYDCLELDNVTYVEVWDPRPTFSDIFFHTLPIILLMVQKPYNINNVHCDCKEWCNFNWS